MPRSSNDNPESKADSQSRFSFRTKSGGIGVLPRRDFLKLGVCAGSALFLASCFPSGSTQGTAKPSASTEPSVVLHIAIGTLSSENWINRFGNVEQRFLWSQIGDPIYGVNRKDGASFDPSEGLMDAVDLQDNGATIVLTVRIKKGIPFHYNEGIVTASDIKFSWVQMTLKDATNADTGNHRNIINNDPDNIKVVDDQTLRFVLTREWAQPFMQNRLSNALGGEMDGAVSEAYFA